MFPIFGRRSGVPLKAVSFSVVGLLVSGSVGLSTTGSLSSGTHLIRPVATATPSTGPRFPGTGCPSFPADNVLNTPITDLPVNPNSARWLASMDSSTTYLHPDYGPSGSRNNPYGIPYLIVSPSRPLVHVSFEYADQSNSGPYPFSSSTPIEGGRNASGDRHALMVNPATCKLYELWDAYYKPNGKSTAGSGAVWSLRSNALRPAGWTSADAAGLPIAPLLVQYSEVRTGTLDHAIRFTADCTRQ